MAVKRTPRVDRNRVPMNPNEVEKRKARILEMREYVESLKSGRPIGEASPAPIEGMDVDGGTNITAIEKQIEREEKALAYMAPKEGTTSEKKKAQRDFDEAKEYIEKNGLSTKELGMYPCSGSPEKDIDYGHAVEKSITQEVGNPKFNEMCNQLKRAASILDPDNPELRNVNRYRAK